MNSSRIIEKAKDLFFKKYPDRKCQEKRRVVGEILEIIETYFEAKRKTGSQKSRKQLSHK